MAVKYSPLEYLYASSRIRAMEVRLVGRERLAALADTGTYGDAVAFLEALISAPVRSEDGSVDTERTLQAYLKAELDAVLGVLPDRCLAALVQYPYDCHNVKSYLKARARGISPEDLLLDTGSVPVEKLLSAFSTEDFSALPPAMAAAIDEAKRSFAKTADPREIDFLLDVACFADMKEAVTGLPFAERVLATRADLINLITALRLLRLGNPSIAPLLFEKVALGVGTVPVMEIKAQMERGEDALLSYILRTPYDAVFAKVQVERFSAVEKRADDYLMREVQTAKAVPFGAEVAVAYLLALDASVRNLRILLAAKAAGVSVTTLKERLRESYV